MIKRFKTFLYEMALPLSTYKKVISKAKPNFDIQKKYFEIFSHYDTGPRKGKKPYRIYFPLNIDIKQETKKKFSYKEELLNKVLNYFYTERILEEKWKMENILLGLIKTEDSKKVIKINKILNKTLKKYEKNAEKIWPQKEFIKNTKGIGKRADFYDFITVYLKEMIEKEINENKKLEDTLKYYQLKSTIRYFETIPMRKQIAKNKFTVVISHHPYDIAGMSTGRGWKSCMTLFDGGFHTYVYSDIENGTIIAYLVSDNDFNIERPIGRILIKPFINFEDDSKFILIPEIKVYGNSVSKFKIFVDKWCEEVNKKYLGFDKNTLYCLNPKLYDDSDIGFINVENLNKDTINNIDILNMDENLLHLIAPDILIYHRDFANLSEYIIEEILNYVDYISPEIAAELLDNVVDVRQWRIFSNIIDYTYKYLDELFSNISNKYNLLDLLFSHEYNLHDDFNMNETEWKKIFTDHFDNEEFIDYVLENDYLEKNIASAAADYFIENKLWKSLSDIKYYHISTDFFHEYLFSKIDEMYLNMTKEDFEKFEINFSEYNNDERDFYEHNLSLKTLQKIIDEFLDKKNIDKFVCKWDWFIDHLVHYLEYYEVKITLKNIEKILYLFAVDKTQKLKLNIKYAGEAIREAIKNMTEAERKTLYLRVSSAEWYDDVMKKEFPILEE